MHVARIVPDWIGAGERIYPGGLVFWWVCENIIVIIPRCSNLFKRIAKQPGGCLATFFSINAEEKELLTKILKILTDNIYVFLNFTFQSL